MKKYLIALISIFIIIFVFFFIGTKTKTPEPKFLSEMQYKSLNVSERTKQFNKPLVNNTCGTIHLAKGIKLYNVSGYILSQTYAGAKVYLTPAKSTDFKTAQQVAKRCHVFWEETISTSRKFMFVGVPEGRFVVFIEGRSYPQYRGPPLPYENNTQGYTINISFHGGNSMYMMSAFEIFENNQS